MNKYLVIFKNYIFTILVIVIPFAKSFSQQTKPILERTITLKFQNMRTDAVLNMIATQGKFNFSYSPTVIDVSEVVSGAYVNKPVRELLNSLFGDKVSYKEKNNYLILKRGKEKPALEQPKDWITFSGYIREDNGTIIPWASVYDKASLESTISNDYSYFKIRFFVKQLPLILNFSKEGYLDTALFIQKNTSQFLNVEMRRTPLTPKSTQVDSVNLSAKAEKTAGSFFRNLESPENAKNISDTLYRKWQFGLLPFIGSNGRLSGNVINDYSLNLFGGYSMGVRKLELAGYFNLTRGDASYAQLAGFVNLNGGNVNGAQLAGFTNLVKGDVNGAQLAGFVNVGWQDFEGVQMAGFVNTVKGKMDGVQLAGFVNTVLDTVTGFQLAGFCNVASKSMKGTQISSFCNTTVDTTGTQLGFVNYAKHINGNQFGFLNISQSTTGIPIGFLSYVHNGYHKLEISADEIMPVNVALRTGVTSFHNILTAGFKPGSGDSLIWNFGYGIGSSVKLSPKTLLDFDLTSSQIVEGNNIENINILNKIYVGIDTRIAHKMSLAIGATLNGQLTKTNYNNYPDIFTYYTPNIFYTNTWELDKTKLQMWLGAKVALRFF